METGGNKYLTLENKTAIIDKIQNSPKLPGNFLKVYDAAYPKSLYGNYWGYIFEKLIDNKSERKCPCRKVIYFVDRELTFPAIAEPQIGLEIEDYLSQTECLQYILSNFEFMNGVIGIENVSTELFGKPLLKLSDVEIVELLVIMKNPVYYKKHPDSEMFELERKRILKKLGTTKPILHTGLGS